MVISDYLMSGRVCMVTGANSGIGKVITGALAKSGATVIMVCRDQKKGELARDEISGTKENQLVDLMISDFSSLDSVRKLVSEFTNKYDKLHLLVNNAGLIIGKRVITPDKLETTFQVNYLSHFLLTNLLLDTLKASAPSRIVNVSSTAHYRGHIDFADLQGEMHYSAMKSYSQSKLAQVLFTHELAERTKGSGVTVNSVHPGAVRTNWGDEAGLLGIGIRIARPFMISPSMGARTPLYVATSPDVEVITGEYFSKSKITKSSRESHDETISEKLWDISMKLSGLI